MSGNPGGGTHSVRIVFSVYPLSAGTTEPESAWKQAECVIRRELLAGVLYEKNGCRARIGHGHGTHGCSGRSFRQPGAGPARVRHRHPVGGGNEAPLPDSEKLHQKAHTMFCHVKELQFNARVSRPDPRFAKLLLEQFGGPNGELKAAMQYFVQAFACKKPYPDKYDMLMDIATEELSHLEIVGATIQMLLAGVNGELKDAVETADITAMPDRDSLRDVLIQAVLANPQFGVLTGGGPRLTDSNGVPWQGAYVNANGELTVDLRSNIAAESRAKIVYEYLLKFTDDPDVRETLGFLMTREVAHFQQFQAALETIRPNFPPAVLQSDPKYSNLYYDTSKGEDARGPWNEGKSAGLGETWQYIDDPVEQVNETDGLRNMKPTGTDRTEASVRKMDKQLSKQRSEEVNSSMPRTDLQWSRYGMEEKGERMRARKAEAVLEE